MEKRRVYQVAKEKKLSSDALISMLKSMDFEVKSHMSVVTEEMLDSITKKIEDEQKSSKEEVQRQKEKEESRKREVAKAKRDAAAEAPKGGDTPQRSLRAIRRQAELGGSGQGKVGTTAPPPVPGKGSDDRKRGKRRRGKEEAVEQSQGDGAEKTDRDAAPSQGGAQDLSGRWRGGVRQRRRRPADAQTVQDNVRKTLSQIAEGRTKRRYDRGAKEEGGEEGEELNILKVREFVTVGELAEQMGARPNEVIATCLQLGVVVSINQRLDMDTIVTVADEFGFSAKPMEEEEEALLEEPEDDEEEGALEPRSPVVTVMGHVDHGKTSLLDYLRKTNVVEGESGGITQHIGAYMVQTPSDHAITFLDTPGHAAFTAMRARGSRITDLVVLVVAADDSVMPQTVEAIDHAKAAGVPIVVAINKVDLPTAEPDRIKRELSERGVLLEDWGGKVPCAEISAITGAGIDKLLELVTLESELQELQASPSKRARGTVVEAQLDRGRGAVATVLVQEGTLKVGDPFVSGVHGGRVRALLDEHKARLDSAGPSTPIQVLGFSGVPQAGDTFAVAASEREAREITQRRQLVRREQDFRRKGVVTLGDLHYQIQQGKIKELNVVVKGDVDGSVEAINQELGSITHAEVRIAIIHSDVGSINESDVLLASASNAIIIAFRVATDPQARAMSSQEGVDIREYDVIYEVIEELRAALQGLLAPEVQTRVVGVVEVRETFSSSRAGNIAGCHVQKGKIGRDSRIRVQREGETVYEGGLASLRRFKDDVREVLEGYECGLAVEGFDDVQIGDLLEAIEFVESARTL